MGKDIAGAYAEEQRYMADKLKGLDTSWPDRLAQYGYTMPAYELDKMDYIYTVLSPKILVVPVSSETNMLSVVADALVNNQAVILEPSFNSLFTAFVGSNMEIYPDKCAELGVDIIYTDFSGGTIIECQDDINMIFVFPKVSGVSAEHIVDMLLGVIQKYEPAAYKSNNDFMLNGCKIGGTSIADYNGLVIFGFNISLTDVTEVCSEIIPPRSTKPVGHLIANKSQMKEDIYQAFSGVR